MSEPSVPQAVLDELRAAVDPAGYVDDPAELRGYLEEWRGLFHGRADLALKPASTAEVSAVLGICQREGIAVVPQGGNTGLVGGGVPTEDLNRAQVILSADRLKQVREIDTDNLTMTVEAGCVLETLQSVAAEAGCLFPLSLAAEGSCQIGGNIATNAGGTNVLNYGNTRELVLGLEVVLPDGRVMNDLTGLRKDNTGYDIKQLFIGSEGTLGFISAAVLKLFPAPASYATAWLGVSSPAAAVALYGDARRQLSGSLVGFELLPAIAVDMVTEHLPDARSPLGQPSEWHVLLELAGADDSPTLNSHLERFLGAALEAGSVTDGAIAQSGQQRDQFWALRHGVSEAQKAFGASIKHDVSVPVSAVPAFLERATAVVTELIPGVRPVPFGHLGDGNLHFNLTQPEGASPEDFLGRWEEVADAVHDVVQGLAGSFSAEHGIGVLKTSDLAARKDPVSLELMRSIKQTVDPANIMNPGKLFR